jgi:hypothetical protein
MRYAGRDTVASMTKLCDACDEVGDSNVISCSRNKDLLKEVTLNGLRP